MRTETTTDAANQRGTSKSRQPHGAAPRRRTVARAIELSPVPPLHWWRRHRADAFTPAHLDIIRKAIAGITILGEPRWCDAVRGDAAAAIGVALRMMKRRDAPYPVIDLVMSAVLLPALAGDPAAVQVLTTMIDRKGANADKNDLKTSWTESERNFARTSIAAAKDNLDPASNRTTAGD